MMMTIAFIAFCGCILSTKSNSAVEAFVQHPGNGIIRSSTTSSSSNQRRQQRLDSFWRHWIPETDFMSVLNKDDNTNKNNDDEHDDGIHKILPQKQQSQLFERTSALTAVLSMSLVVLLLAPQVGVAVSGGGLDYAGIDISGQDFSNGNYRGKDFTQVIAKGTNFAKSNLQGCRFYKAYLVRRRRRGEEPCHPGYKIMFSPSTQFLSPI
jgi:hypothetical protein